MDFLRRKIAAVLQALKPSVLRRTLQGYYQPIFRPADLKMLLVVLAGMFGLPLLIYLRILWLGG